jgi:hypothetical protein
MASSSDRLTARGHRWPTDQRGSMLIGTVLAMLLLTVLALSLAMSGTLEGKVAINHYALVKGLHVADAGIEGVRKELTDCVNNPACLPSGWTGVWSPVLAAKGAVCNNANGVAFNFSPTGGASWSLTGANPTLFITNNSSDPAETGNPDPNCTDTDGIITVIADGRTGAAGAFGASKRIAVDLFWRPDASGTEGGRWGEAVQGGSGGAAQITGNAMVYGGVALNNTGGGTAWAMGGGAGIRNNYENAGPSSEQLRATTRALLNPTLLALGDVSLDATFRVQQGTVTFSGGATAGVAQGSTTGRKQTLDMALANDFDPAAVSAIHADRTGQATGTGASVPLLSSAVSTTDTRTWEQMLNQDGLHITAADLTASCGGPCSGNVIDGYTGTPIPATSQQRFCVYSNMAAPPPGPPGAPACTRKWTISCPPAVPLPCGVQSKFDLIVDQAPNPNTATLAVQGLIVFDNFGTGQGIRFGGLNGGGPESLGTITYTGSATIFVDNFNNGGTVNDCTGAAVCAGRLTIAADIVTPAASFPTAVNPPVYPPAAGTVNTIGFMADQIGIAYGADNTSISASNLTLTGLFYAQSQIYMCKQTETLGSLLSAQVTISCNVPKIAAIKQMSRFLPSGLIGGPPPGAPLPTGMAVVVRWRELPRP